MDAGSAGPVNLVGFRKLVHERSTTRMIGFVALAQHGVLNEPGELLNTGFADRDEIGASGDRRIATSASASKSGCTKSIGKTAAMPCGWPSMPARRQAHRLWFASAARPSVWMRLPILRPGDIITHCYTPQKPSIIDDHGKLLPLVRKAKERGVIFDVGHAGGHFDFNLVERAIGEGIVPDIISSDLHSRLAQPGFGIISNLPTTLTNSFLLD